MRAQNLIERIANEVKIHSQLQHPSIVELYHYFEDYTFVYLVMEYCEIGEISHYLV